MTWGLAQQIYVCMSCWLLACCSEAHNMGDIAEQVAIRVACGTAWVMPQQDCASKGNGWAPWPLHALLYMLCGWLTESAIEA